MFIFIISFKQLTYNSSIFFILISYVSEVHSILIFVYPAYPSTLSLVAVLQW